MTKNRSEWMARPLDFVHQSWLVLREAILGFEHNDDFRHASSLAYYTALALLPALLLLTYALGAGLGASQTALQRMTDLVSDVIPQYSDVILREVSAVYRHKGTAGILTLCVLIWTISPLVGSLRSIVDGMFRVKPHRSPWTTKLLDLLAVMLSILGLAAISATSVSLELLKRHAPGFPLLHSTGRILPGLMTVALLLCVYAVFVPRMRFHKLLLGALTTALLWSLLRPGFQFLLTVNPHFGFAFGSFKSVFVVVIWLYYSLAVLLLGAEMIAALHRKDTVIIKSLMQGRRGLGRLGRQRFLRQVPLDETFFLEGEAGSEMYHVLSGSVSIRKGETEIAVIGPGKFFGEMTFLLGTCRSATAVAREDCECIVINPQNLDALMREFPDTIRDMLVEMAQRLQQTSEKARTIPH
jgi:membrane protein